MRKEERMDKNAALCVYLKKYHMVERVMRA